ncbi:hypothetical protein CTI12_AA315650 [Artemisia annua]|uniref:MSP domain-containing protein n=1 Tax=Artemisia annua TaxID=35608 RepID=A0A2U1N2D1_ARTAN|nr:hypothetical protein CTI12_AA315650 [Artemisia annua]
MCQQLYMEPSTKDDDFGEIEPKELRFVFEPEKQISCTVNLINKSDRYMAFKVKATTPKTYCVRPNVGIIQPHSTCQVHVKRQAENVVPSSDVIAKERFLFQRAFVYKVTPINDLSPIFRSIEGGKYINETKFKVALNFTKEINLETEEEDLKVRESQDIPKTDSDIDKLALSLKKAKKTISELMEQKINHLISKPRFFTRNISSEKVDMLEPLIQQ